MLRSRTTNTAGSCDCRVYTQGPHAAQGLTLRRANLRSRRRPHAYAEVRRGSPLVHRACTCPSWIYRRHKSRRQHESSLRADPPPFRRPDEQEPPDHIFIWRVRANRTVAACSRPCSVARRVASAIPLCVDPRHRLIDSGPSSRLAEAVSRPGSER